MISSFSDQYSFLSNFHPSDVEVGGRIFKNSEAAYQSYKDLSRQDEFLLLTPWEAKKLGRKVKIRSEWDSIKDNIMHMVVKAKFTQSATLTELILQTSDQDLIEGNYWKDTYWGVCEGVGQNKLGHILMRVREELRSSKYEKEGRPYYEK